MGTSPSFSSLLIGGGIVLLCILVVILAVGIGNSVGHGLTEWNLP